MTFLRKRREAVPGRRKAGTYSKRSSPQQKKSWYTFAEKQSPAEEKLVHIRREAVPSRRKAGTHSQRSSPQQKKSWYIFEEKQSPAAGTYSKRSSPPQKKSWYIFEEKQSPAEDRLGGLVVKASASRAEDPWFESRLCRDFFGVESYQ